MTSAVNPALEPLIDNNLPQDEKEDSDLQLLWSKVMDEGDYTNCSTYTKVEVLLLCWAESCDDLTTKKEVEDLKATFEKDFNYHATIEYLDIMFEQKIQVRVNAKVAAFVDAHDGPNTLLIVYYAGHGRPGQKYGQLELFGFVKREDNIARSLTSAGKRHQMMTNKNAWTVWYGTRLKNYCR